MLGFLSLYLSKSVASHSPRSHTCTIFILRFHHRHCSPLCSVNTSLTHTISHLSIWVCHIIISCNLSFKLYFYKISSLLYKLPVISFISPFLCNSALYQYILEKLWFTSDIPSHSHISYFCFRLLLSLPYFVNRKLSCFHYSSCLQFSL